MKYVFSCLLFLGNLTASAQSFQDFLNLINGTPVAQRQAKVDSFMATITQAPLLEQDTTAIFIYQNPSATSVANPGDHNFWTPTAHPLNQVFGTDFWYRIGNYEPNARIDYKFVVNGNQWILDPLNPNLVSGGFGPNSELAMPQYIQPWEIEHYPGTPSGTQFTESFASDTMNDTYQVRYLFPPGYDSTLAVGYPTVYFHDGLEYLSLGSAGNVIENLLDSGLIRPFIGVFVRPEDRNEEYAFSKRFKFKNFIIHELIPSVDDRFNTRIDSMERYMIGTSFGANISSLIAFNHPDVIMNLGLHSPAFWPNNYEAGQLIFSTGRYDLDVAAVWGSYEGSLHQDWVWAVDTLQQLGMNIYGNYYPEGHSWGLWRATLDELLIQLLPFQPSGLWDSFAHQANLTVFPNPASHTLGFQTKGDVQHISRVRVLNMQGRVVLESPNDHALNLLDVSGLKPGFYILESESQGGSKQRVAWIKQ